MPFVFGQTKPVPGCRGVGRRGVDSGFRIDRVRVLDHFQRVNARNDRRAAAVAGIQCELYGNRSIELEGPYGIVEAAAVSVFDGAAYREKKSVEAIGEGDHTGINRYKCVGIVRAAVTIVGYARRCYRLSRPSCRCVIGLEEAREVADDQWRIDKRNSRRRSVSIEGLRRGNGGDGDRLCGDSSDRGRNKRYCVVIAAVPVGYRTRRNHGFSRPGMFCFKVLSETS